MNRSDRTFIAGLLVDPTVRRHLGGPVPIAGINAKLAAYQSEASDAPYWIVEKAQRRCGLVTLTPHKDSGAIELSYQLMPRVWGRGIAHRACQLACDCAFGPMDISQIIAETQAANDASCQLLRRLGFTETRRLHRFGAEQIIFARSR